MSNIRRIKVEQKHIDTATPENSSSCMIAEAIKDTYPDAKKVHVDLQTIRFTDAKGVRRTYLTPGRCQVALVKFDAGDDDLTEFSFQLGMPIHLRNAKAAAPKATPNSERSQAGRRGGRSIPLIKATTRRRFGIRGLRINQAGRVVQIGTEQEAAL